jgi:hypothetical protein
VIGHVVGIFAIQEVKHFFFNLRGKLILVTEANLRGREAISWPSPSLPTKRLSSSAIFSSIGQSQAPHRTQPTSQAPAAPRVLISVSVRLRRAADAKMTVLSARSFVSGGCSSGVTHLFFSYFFPLLHLNIVPNITY